MSNRYLPLVLLSVIGAVAAEPKRDRYGDPLPEGAIARLGSLRLRHGGSVRVTGFSHDGKTLSAFAGGNSLTCWDTVSGRKAGRVPIGYCSQPRCLRYSPDGKSLILADWPCVFRILDAITGTERIKLEPEKIDPRYKDIRALAVSQDGQRVAVVTNGAKPQVTLRDVKRDKPAVKAALPDDSRVVEILFAPDGRRLLVRSWHGAVRVLDGTTGRRVRDLKPDTSGRRIFTTPAFAPDGRSVVLYDDRLCIREVASSKVRLSIALKNAPIDLLVSPNGRFLVTSSRDSDDFSIRVFSTATGKLLANRHGNQSSATALSFSPDSRLLASGGYDGTILLWKLPEDDGLPAKLSQEEAASFWQALADEDAARANRALAGLAAAPAQALPLLKERFRTEWKKPDAEQLARLIADLDADAFKVRERATQELSEAGTDAADALRKALANKPSPEVQRRGEILLKRLNEDGDPERLRSLRAIEILERIGTPQAGELLRELAGKPLPAELHEDIEASLRRMEKRQAIASERTQTP